MINRLKNVIRLFMRWSQPQVHSSIASAKSEHEKLNEINVLNTKTGIVLAKLQQQALAAYFAFLYIVSFKPDDYLKDPRSIQKRLIDRPTFNDFIIQHTKKYYQIEDIRELGLEEANINEVLCGFNIFSGAFYQKKIRRSAKFQRWYDDRNPFQGEIQISEDYGCYKSKYGSSQTLFFPTLLTGQIFRKMLEGQNLFISSGEFTGKSYAFLLYEHLSSFMINCRMSQNTGLNTQPFKSLLEDSYFYKIRKILYVQQMDRFENFSSLFECRIANYYPKQSNQNKSINENKFQTSGDGATEYSFKQDIIEIVEAYRKKGLQSTIVLDEYQQYYNTLKRRINEGLIGKSYQQQVVNLWRSKAAETIHNCYTQLILVSDDYKIPALIQKQAIKFGQFNFYDHQKPTVQNFIIEHPKMLFQQQGQIQNYGFLWFKLEKFLFSENIILPQRNKLRLIFEQIFCIPNSKGNKQNKQLLPWNRYTNFVKFYYKEDMQLNKYIRLKQSIQLKKILLNLKQQCQNYKHRYCAREISIYLRQNASEYDRNIRLSIIIYIEQKAIQIVDKGIRKQLQQNFFQVSLKQIGKYIQIGNQDINQLKEHINIVAQYSQIGFYDKEEMLMTVFSRPKDFIKDLLENFGVSQNKYDQKEIFKNKVIKQLIRQRIQQKRKYLKVFIQLIFKYKGVLNLSLNLLQNIQPLQKQVIFQWRYQRQNKRIQNSIKNIIAAAENIQYSDQYASLVPQGDDKCHFDGMLVRKLNAESVFEIVTFSWYIHQLHGNILVDESQSSPSLGTNKQNITSLEEIDQMTRQVFGADSPQQIILNKSFKKHQFYSFIKMMLQSTEPEGIHWHHIIVLPNSNELLQKYSKDSTNRMWTGDKLLFEGQPQWIQNGKPMKFSCNFAYMQRFQKAINIQRSDIFQSLQLNRKITENIQIESFYQINPSWFLQSSKDQTEKIQ